MGEGVSATVKGVQRQGDLAWPVQQGAASHEEPYGFHVLEVVVLMTHELKSLFSAP